MSSSPTRKPPRYLLCTLYMGAEMTSATHVEVVMPQLGISVTEGTIVQWRKRPGDAVAYEEPICDIDTDKIESELPSPVAGVLVEILVEVGETVNTGTAIALIASDGSHEVPVAVVDAAEPKPTGGSG